MIELDDRNHGEVDVLDDHSKARIGSFNPWEVALNNLENALEDRHPKFEELRQRFLDLQKDIEIAVDEVQEDEQEALTDPAGYEE